MKINTYYRETRSRFCSWTSLLEWNNRRINTCMSSYETCFSAHFCHKSSPEGGHYDRHADSMHLQEINMKPTRDCTFVEWNYFFSKPSSSYAPGSGHWTFLLQNGAKSVVSSVDRCLKTRSVTKAVTEDSFYTWQLSRRSWECKRWYPQPLGTQSVFEEVCYKLVNALLVYSTISTTVVSNADSGVLQSGAS